MDKKKLTQYNTDFQKVIIEKYAEDIPENDDDNSDYEKVQDFLFIMEAGEQYQVENKLSEYLKLHSDITIKELHDYFHAIVPDGLPPCAVDWEDKDEDEDED